MTTAPRSERAPIGQLKVRPGVWIGFAILVGYAVVVFVVQKLFGCAIHRPER